NVKLRAVNVAGDGTASSAVSVTPRAVPAAPTSLVATPGNGSVSVAFTAGAANGTSITNYEYQLNGSGSWYALSPAVTTSPVTIAGTNGVEYTVKLRAVNSAGSGAASVASSSFTPRTVPSAPTSLVANRGNKAAEIVFTAGANGGAAITNYKYQLDGGSWTAFSPAVTNPSVTVEGLTNGTTYSVKLRAVNAAGDGAISDAASVTPANVNANNWIKGTDPEENYWSSVTYGNGLFVAVSYMTGTKRVMTSPDGIAWTQHSVPENNFWYSVTYGNGLFVAVSSDGTRRVMTSPDGVIWTARSAPADAWTSVTYANGQFVAVSQSGTAMTSPDGLIWTVHAAVTNNWWSVTYGNGLFVAVSFNGTNRVMTSPDGVTWTARSAPEAKGWRSVTFGNGLFVATAIDSNKPMTSIDGINWTMGSAPGRWYEGYNALTYGNGLFVATGQNLVITSTDGVTWTTRSPAEWNVTWLSIIYGNGKFVAVAAQSFPTTRVMTAELTEVATPNAPTSLAVTSGKGSASVSFTPGADGGSAITNYEYQLNGSGPWIALSPARVWSPLTISGLTNGTAYTVKLRAVNELGAGAASVASESFTPLLGLVTPAQEGTISILAGTGSSDFPTPGTATDSALLGLNGMTVDSSGNIYISDNYSNKVFKITSDGVLSVFAGAGFYGPLTPGPADSSALSSPSGLAADAAGNIYVVTSSRQVAMITPDGTLSVVAGTGTWFDPNAHEYGGTEPVLVPGPATSVDLNSPNDVAIDSDGNLYILDSGYRQVLKVTTDGTLSVFAGNGSFDAPTEGPATSSAMGTPTGIAIDSSGNLYIADSLGGRVLQVTSGGNLSIFAGTGSTGLPTPGPAVSSTFGELTGIAADSSGNVFVTDFTNRVVAKITPDGTLTIVAGNGYQGFPTAGPVADSDLGRPFKIAVDADGNIYMLDFDYYLLEKVTFAPVPTIPAAPTDLVATPGSGSVSVAFTAGSDGGEAVTNYEYSTDGGSSWTAFSPSVTSSPVAITGLSNGSSYNITLRAVNAVGSGDASVASSSFTPRMVPAAPTDLAATPGDSSVSVSFTADFDGGAAITNYEYSTDGGSSWTAFSPAVTSSPVMITGLTNASTYNVKLRSVNAAGDGIASSAVSVTPRTVPS
ncbi:MAG: hypothetical protein F2837_12115, partial [Actinobacteria bacterium]|nr:hypothetical protein [Actinomycetota bacterium]